MVEGAAHLLAVRKQKRKKRLMFYKLFKGMPTKSHLLKVPALPSNTIGWVPSLTHMSFRGYTYPNHCILPLISKVHVCLIMQNAFNLSPRISSLSWVNIAGPMSPLRLQQNPSMSPCKDQNKLYTSKIQQCK